MYDKAAFSVLGLNTSLLVPPLLISFYVVLGSLQIIADKALIDTPATQRALSKLSPQYLLINTWYAAHLTSVFGMPLATTAFTLSTSFRPSRHGPSDTQI